MRKAHAAYSGTASSGSIAISDRSHVTHPWKLTTAISGEHNAAIHIFLSTRERQEFFTK